MTLDYALNALLIYAGLLAGLAIFVRQFSEIIISTLLMFEPGKLIENSRLEQKTLTMMSDYFKKVIVFVVGLVFMANIKVRFPLLPDPDVPLYVHAIIGAALMMFSAEAWHAALKALQNLALVWKWAYDSPKPPLQPIQEEEWDEDEFDERIST